MLKLRAAGVDVDPFETGAPVAIASPAGVPGLRGSEDVLGILLSAIDSRQAVQFPHRPSRAEPYTTGSTTSKCEGLNASATCTLAEPVFKSAE